MLLSLNVGFWKVEKNQLFLYKTSKTSDPAHRCLDANLRIGIYNGKWFLFGLFSKSESQRKNINQSAGRHSSDPRTFRIFFEKVTPAAWKVNIKMF